MSAVYLLKGDVKRDCFAYNEYGCCDALNVRTCAGCKFYKNRDAYREENMRLYGFPEPIYRSTRTDQAST